MKSSQENALLKEINSLKADLEKTLNDLQSFKNAKEVLEKENSSLESQVIKNIYNIIY